MADTVRLNTGVTFMSVGQLEVAYGRSKDDCGFFEWLRKLVQDKPVLLTSDKGLICHAQAEAVP